MAVFDEDEASLGLQNSPHLFQRFGNAGDRAERPGDDYRVDAFLGKRDRRFRGLQKEFHVDSLAGGSLASLALKLERRIDAVHAVHFGRIEGQIQRGADADL